MHLHAKFILLLLLLFSLALQPSAGYGLLVHEVFLITHNDAHSRYHSSGRVISPSQSPLPDNKQHTQQTNIQDPGEIRPHVRSRQAAVDLRLGPRGHWDRPFNVIDTSKAFLAVSLNTVEMQLKINGVLIEKKYNFKCFINFQTRSEHNFIHCP
jgi:hypothetical protein